MVEWRFAKPGETTGTITNTKRSVYRWFSVSYIHSHPLVDVKLNSNGYGGFGKADPGIPGVFTDRWWETWNWFSGKCADAGVGLGLDDYVIGWTKMDIM